MSDFNHYAKELDSICKGYFGELVSATTELNFANEQYGKYIRPKGVIGFDAKGLAKSAEVERNLSIAKERIYRVKTTLLAETNAKIKTLRTQMKDRLDSIFLADPAAVDPNLLAILDSGMLTVGEYERLYEKTAKENNHTMARLICAAAREAAGEAKKEEDRLRLANLSRKSAAHSSDSYLSAFDEIVDLFETCSGNPLMKNRWDECVGPLIKNF